MISREIWKKHAIMCLSKTTDSTHTPDSCYFQVFEKLTCACFFLPNHAITLYTNCPATKFIIPCSLAVFDQVLATPHAWLLNCYSLIL